MNIGGRMKIWVALFILIVEYVLFIPLIITLIPRRHAVKIIYCILIVGQVFKENINILYLFFAEDILETSPGDSRVSHGEKTRNTH